MADSITQHVIEEGVLQRLLPFWGMHTTKLKSHHPDIVSEIYSITSWMPEHAPLKCRFWHIVNRLYTLPKCKKCDNLVSWLDPKSRYATYCSNECVSKDEKIKTKRKATNLQKYGGVAPASSETVRLKMIRTIKTRYGVENVLQDETIREKQRNTVLERYGVDNVSKLTEVKEKKTATTLKNHGVDNFLKSDQINEYKKTDDFKLRLRNASGGRRATNIGKYGVVNVAQRHIPPDSLQKLNSADWLIEQHHINRLNCQYIADLLGVDRHTVHSYLRAHNLEICRYFRSTPEIELESFIRNLGLDVKHNIRDVIGTELDLYIPDKRLAIEYCGLYWHSEDIVGKNYHRNKFLMCRQKGIRLVTIFEDEYEFNKDLVLQKLRSILGLDDRERIHARACSIVDVDKDNKRLFLNQNHIQGDGTSSINVGLVHDGCVVAVMALYQTGNGLILNRYATSKRVPGGFSKLLKHIIKRYPNTHIETFADLRWSVGDLYEKSGFVPVSELPEDYSYIRGGKRYHKFGFRHEKLKSKLESYDASLTEVENMKRHGFSRIWDCGKIKYRYT